MDEKREIKEPPSCNFSSSGPQINPTEKRTPIEVFQVPASSGDSHSKGEATHEPDEPKSSLSSFRPAASMEASKKWMAFESENFDITKIYTKNFDGSFRSYSTKLLETNMTKRTAEENKIDRLSSLQLTYVISDATKPDYPIMFASNRFLAMTGYTLDEVIGRNW